MSEAPFKVGDHVRMKHAERSQWRKFKSYTGVVVKARSVHRFPDGTVYQQIAIHRDGLARRDPWSWGNSFWELIPVTELTQDQTAQSLADAVKRGDVTAALALADRVFELCGATPTEVTA